MKEQLTDWSNANSGFCNTSSGWVIAYGYATQEDIDTMTSFLNSINRLAWEKVTGGLLKTTFYSKVNWCNLTEENYPTIDVYPF